MLHLIVFPQSAIVSAFVLIVRLADLCFVSISQSHANCLHKSQQPAPAPVPAPGPVPASTPIPTAAPDAPSSQATIPDQSQQLQPTQQPQADSGPQPPTSSTPTKPSRTGTPAATNSRAASVHPDPQPKFPSEAAPHGAPVRQYLNSKVTGALMEGMKKIAKERPKDPLRVLGEYLLQRSKEVEGTS
ncbi:COMPASS (complex proteins associated with Set1p) component [Coniochaeta pulveracea]|uniref:COMPASS (Complex proteins associated with Set1p) component n=1 Tax=Coniochaeta pulveracea TaxID=177199 RepID=A0A420YEZ7_9PEZI|nr:COMPASS (complex proteins associated with Set1p) component [Coniochaeta pulveracea]